MIKISAIALIPRAMKGSLAKCIIEKKQVVLFRGSILLCFQSFFFKLLVENLASWATLKLFFNGFLRRWPRGFGKSTELGIRGSQFQCAPVSDELPHLSNLSEPSLKTGHVLGTPRAFPGNCGGTACVESGPVPCEVGGRVERRRALG